MSDPAPAPRLLPQLPPAGERLRVLIDNAAATETDDLHAIALALRSTYRFAIVGFLDLGDTAWVFDPGLCTHEVVDAPERDFSLFFARLRGGPA